MHLPELTIRHSCRTIHEVAFGLLVTLAAFRIFYLLFYALADLRARQPETFKEAGRLFAYGIGSFLLGESGLDFPGWQAIASLIIACCFCLRLRLLERGQVRSRCAS